MTINKYSLTKKWFKTPREERLKTFIEQILNEAKRECMSMIGVQTVRPSDDAVEDRAFIERPAT